MTCYWGDYDAAVVPNIWDNRGRPLLADAIIKWCFILCTAQFDGVERMSKEESGSPTVKQQTLRHKSWTPKSLRPNPPSPTSPSSPSTTPESETPIVDPTLPLEKQRCVFKTCFRHYWQCVNEVILCRLPEWNGEIKIVMGLYVLKYAIYINSYDVKHLIT